MLKAIHKMLEKPDTTVKEAWDAKIECARDVLGELIEHLETPKSAVYDSPRTYIDEQLDPDAQEAQKELTG